MVLTLDEDVSTGWEKDYIKIQLEYNGEIMPARENWKLLVISQERYWLSLEKRSVDR